MAPKAGTADLSPPLRDSLVDISSQSSCVHLLCRSFPSAGQKETNIRTWARLQHGQQRALGTLATQWHEPWLARHEPLGHAGTRRRAVVLFPSQTMFSCGCCFAA